METAAFKPSDPFSVLSLVDIFKTAYDSTNTHKGAALSLFPYFIREPTKATLSHQVEADTEKDHQQEGKLAIYCQVASYMLEAYATDNVIGEAKANIGTLKEPARMTAVCCSEILWVNPPQQGRVYDKSILKETFVERLHYSTSNSLRT